MICAASKIWSCDMVIFDVRQGLTERRVGISMRWSCRTRDAVLTLIVDIGIFRIAITLTRPGMLYRRLHEECQVWVGSMQFFALAVHALMLHGFLAKGFFNLW